MQKAIGLGLAAVFCSVATAASMSNVPHIWVGITPGGHEPEHVSVFAETQKALQNHFGRDRVHFDTVHVTLLTDDIVTNRRNFFISTAGLSRRMKTCSP